jgi:hypothetical protein
MALLVALDVAAEAVRMWETRSGFHIRIAHC